MKQITLTVEGAKMSLSTNEPIALPDIIEILTNGIRCAATQALADCPSEFQDDARADIYDMVNQAISFILNEMSPPDVDLQLTEAAILLAQNQIIEEATKRNVPVSQIYLEHKQKSEELVNALRAGEIAMSNVRKMS